MNATSISLRVGRRLLIWWGTAAALAVFSGSALADIANTKHNLSSSGNSPSGKSNTSQICVFCHTPHASDKNTPARAPLWNRKIDTTTTYTLYSSLGTQTLDGTVLPVGSTSLACLSCHDGTQAMDSVINAPGSGGYNAAGARFGTWTAGASGGTGGVIGTADNPIPRLGTDLSDDHPIGIAYCGGGLTFNLVSGAITSATCVDTDFKMPTLGIINSYSALWVEVDNVAGRAKGDIPLYVRNFGSNVLSPTVECGSCHDPHIESAADGVNFMRVSTAGSQICLSCHVK